MNPQAKPDADGLGEELQTILAEIDSRSRAGEWEALPELGRRALSIASELGRSALPDDPAALERRRLVLERLLAGIGSITQIIEPARSKLGEDLCSAQVRSKVNTAYGMPQRTGGA